MAYDEDVSDYLVFGFQPWAIKAAFSVTTEFAGTRAGEPSEVLYELRVILVEAADEQAAAERALSLLSADTWAAVRPVEYIEEQRQELVGLVRPDASRRRRSNDPLVRLRARLPAPGRPRDNGASQDRTGPMSTGATSPPTPRRLVTTLRLYAIGIVGLTVSAVLVTISSLGRTFPSSELRLLGKGGEYCARGEMPPHWAVAALVVLEAVLVVEAVLWLRQARPRARLEAWAFAFAFTATQVAWLPAHRCWATCRWVLENGIGR